MRAGPDREVAGEVARSLREKDAREAGEAVQLALVQPVLSAREAVDVRARRLAICPPSQAIADRPKASSSTRANSDFAKRSRIGDVPRRSGQYDRWSYSDCRVGSKRRRRSSSIAKRARSISGGAMSC